VLLGDDEAIDREFVMFGAIYALRRRDWRMGRERDRGGENRYEMFDAHERR
jgi:hypothetical protein